MHALLHFCISTYVNGNPQQIDAACNAFKVFLAEESALAEPPTTSPVATKPSMTAQIKRWIGFCSSLPLAANVSTTNEPESIKIILNVKRKKSIINKTVIECGKKISNIFIGLKKRVVWVF